MIDKLRQINKVWKILNNALPASFKKHEPRQSQAYRNTATMATENVSVEEKQNTFLVERVYCSADITATIQGQLTFISALNVLLAITAFIGNALILVALRKESSLHPPSKHLLRCLTTADLCVGLIVDSLYVTLLVIVVKEHCSICFPVAFAVSITGFSLGAMPLLTLTAISVDRLLALLLGLRYRQVVTLNARLLDHYYLLRCVHCLFSNDDVLESPYRVRVCHYSYLSVSSNLDLLLHEDFLHPPTSSNQLQDHVQQPNQTNHLNIARYRKAVFTTLWLQFILVVCYLPFLLIILVINSESSSSASLAWSYTLT